MLHFINLFLVLSFFSSFFFNVKYNIRKTKIFGGPTGLIDINTLDKILIVLYITIIFFVVSPRLAYLSSELLERHAVYTYTEFFESNESILKGLKPTREMLDYDPYCESMYEIFTYIAKYIHVHTFVVQIARWICGVNMVSTMMVIPLLYRFPTVKTRRLPICNNIWFMRETHGPVM